MLKKHGYVIFGTLIAVSAIVFWIFDKDTRDKYEPVEYDESLIPQYEEIKAPFSNEFESKESLPILGSAIIDIDNDGVEEMFVGGGVGQKDAILKFSNGKFIDIGDDLGFEKDISQTTYGSAVIDMTQDGIADLLVARDDAVYLYVNNEGKFSKPQNLNLIFNEKSQPISITVADLNRDGWVDMFVSTYLKPKLLEEQTIFNRVGYGSVSKLFLNNGDNTFQDITESAGLTYVHNTFCAVFVDLNNDGEEDLVVAHDTGEPRIYKNSGNLKFIKVKHPLSDVFSYPMGIAVGDYDNNGYQDIFFSNVGSSLPEAFVRGDLTKDQVLVTDWILLSNEGNFKFADKADEAKVAAYEFSWGAVFEDFNLDGLQDLVVTENYVDLPNSKIRPLSSRFLMQLSDNTFTNIEGKNKTRNPCYGISPLVADFNNDGFPDLVHINLDGDVRAFISKANVENNYLKVNLPATPAYLNATVTIVKGNGKKLTQHNISGEGLASDQTNTLFFGLGKDHEIKSCRVQLIDGTVKNVLVTTVNTTVSLS